MEKELEGTVIEKRFTPRFMDPPTHWCFVTVQLESGERVLIRLHWKIVDQVVVGDEIRFSKPRRENKPVEKVQTLKKATW
jgi:hypothetical protein